MNIFITNDDGYRSQGIAALIAMMRPYGTITVVAPEEGQSGMSNAMTVKVPVRIRKVEESENLKIYACSGTPTDCVKLAMSCLFQEKKPDILVSGINHGSNASIAVIYSGTLGAAAEGTLYGIPSVGFSLTDHSPDADFTVCLKYGPQIIEQILKSPFSPHVFLNVNFPAIPVDEIKGIRLCRQNKGAWVEEYEKRTDPHGHDYFWLTGQFVNHEDQATDTDENALRDGYIAVVPHHLDMTEYNELERLRKEWSW